MDIALCKHLRFPEAAVAYLNQCWGIMEASPITQARITEARQSFFCQESMEWAAILQSIAASTGIHPYTVDLLFMLICVERLHADYQANGLDEEVFEDTIKDIRCKMMECQSVYHIWGTVSLPWQRGFFLRNRFALGRLQYECRPFPKNSYQGIIHHGEPALVCHIPSGEPLRPEMVMDSLARAYCFFLQAQRNGHMVVICNSWMLYPPFEGIFPEGSNVDYFRKMFDVIEQKEDPERTDFWRIFGIPWGEKVNRKDIPQQTTLQRGMLRYLEKGGTMGMGWGVLIFNGRKDKSL